MPGGDPPTSTVGAESSGTETGASSSTGDTPASVCECADPPDEGPPVLCIVADRGQGSQQNVAAPVPEADPDRSPPASAHVPDESWL